MNELITLPKGWFRKGTFLKITVYIENGVLKRTVTDNRFTGKPLSKNLKLTYYQADKIRKEYAKGDISMNALGKKFGVSKRTVGRIINGEGYV